MFSKDGIFFNYYNPGLLILLAYFIAPLHVHAQKEAAIWKVGSGYQFNFQSGNIEISTFSDNQNSNASICDKDGNLVLYTDGRTLWNGKNEILINGEGLINSDAYIDNTPVFLPYPEKEGWYIIVYEEVYYNSTFYYGNTLFYAEINANAYNEQGEVVKKKIKIHNDYHSGPTIAGYCNNSYYWITIDRNDNTNVSINRDRIFFYKIDKNGVNHTPVINDEIDMGNSGGYKFSPNGDKLFFHFETNVINATGGRFYDRIVDFNFTNGNLYNPRDINNDFIFGKEFSPDSRLFYFFSGPYLIQIDAGLSDSRSMMKFADTLLTLASDAENIYPGGEMQLASDGRLYFNYYDIEDKKLKVGRINKPNNKGDACEVELNILTLINLGYYRFPKFVTSFFRDKYPVNLNEVPAEAGPEFTLCPHTTAQIGTQGHPDVQYTWFPDSNLSNPFSAQTIFTAPANYNSTQILTYQLRASDGNCWVNSDFTELTILPGPKDLPIDGSWSVCPFVEGVDYWTVDDNNKLQWLVDGGTIVSNPANDSIKINWGDTNPKASASVFSTNSYQCNSDTAVFPVRINTKLITETPKGPNKMCIAKSNDILYQIRKTNGSVYNWIAVDGEIVSGQGTNRVVVNWKKAGQQFIAVEETSLTIDTICFGTSVALPVEIVNDSLDITLNQISFDNINHVIINYSSAKLQDLYHSLFLLIENERGDLIHEFSMPYPFNGEFIYFPTNMNFISPYTMQFKIINSCNEVFYSNKEESVLLHGEEIVSQDMIHLDWNINRFWQNDRLKHEIWYSENGINDWKLISGDETGLEFSFPVQGLSLTHYFRVKEINMDKNKESWSNTVKVVIDDKLIIPDVFTPNGDGYNDEWQIRNIRFHPAQSVVVYNKTGQVVFQSKNEYIPWDGTINGEIIQGTYFYQITFDAENIRYGQITVLQ